MYSIAFPDIFKSNGTQLVEDNTATLQNINLLLSSWKESLFGDPYFGTNLESFLFEQNNIVLQDLIIDEIYVSLRQFIPQVFARREDIKIVQRGSDIYATINCINKLDNQPNAFEIMLTNDVDGGRV